MQLAEFLKLGERCFSVYILLDHMDWMNGNPSALREEWQSILETAMPDARIIFRSGGMSFEVPDFARRHLRFHSELTQSLHQQDRVGTYGSFYFATLASS
jgi:S-adenosylmethionine-diacylglycerol 3-amino-3-carboxypropyl transferase